LVDRVKTTSRTPILLLAIGLLAVTAIVLVKRHRRAKEGPAYEGRTLGDWLGRIEPAGIWSHPDRTSPFFLQTSNAIVQIGTNGLPFLTEWIRYQPSRAYMSFWSVAIDVVGELPDPVVPDSFRDWIQRSRAMHRSAASVDAFEILGPAAASSVPELLSIVKDPANPQAVRRATHALSAVGPAAFLALFEIASNTNAPTRRVAIHGLGGMGTKAVRAIPMLIQTLDDINGDCAQAAANTLGRLALEPHVVIPALTNAMQRPEHLVRWVAADALAAYGTSAAPAVPALRLALADQNPQVRDAVSNALQVITSRLDPETAERMPR
jgi:HEAT repeat protein